MSKKTPSKLLYLEKSYLERISSTPLLSTPLGKYNAHQLMTYQLETTNNAGMEHVSLSAMTIGFEGLTIRKSHLDDTLIHTNQASASLDTHGHNGCYFSFGII